MPRELQRLSTEELKAIRDQLTRRAQAKKKATPAPLHPHATRDNVLRVMSQADTILTEVRTILWQWQANLDAVGAERLARGDRKLRAIRE
jgi:hypothetical protein